MKAIQKSNDKWLARTQKEPVSRAIAQKLSTQHVYWSEPKYLKQFKAVRG